MLAVREVGLGSCTKKRTGASLVLTLESITAGEGGASKRGAVEVPGRAQSRLTSVNDARGVYA